jgi:hypothetical protein
VTRDESLFVASDEGALEKVLALAPRNFSRAGFLRDFTALVASKKSAAAPP